MEFEGGGCVAQSVEDGGDGLEKLYASACLIPGRSRAHRTGQPAEQTHVWRLTGLVIVKLERVITPGRERKDLLAPSVRHVDRC